MRFSYEWGKEIDSKRIYGGIGAAVSKPLRLLKPEHFRERQAGGFV